MAVQVDETHVTRALPGGPKGHREACESPHIAQRDNRFAGCCVTTGDSGSSRAITVQRRPTITARPAAHIRPEREGAASPARSLAELGSGNTVHRI
jgi:hypothetical protein